MTAADDDLRATLGALAEQYEADARREDYGGELWSTTAANLRALLDAHPARAEDSGAVCGYSRDGLVCIHALGHGVPPGENIGRHHMVAADAPASDSGAMDPDAVLNGLRSAVAHGIGTFSIEGWYALAQRVATVFPNAPASDQPSEGDR